ncbi:hypothetical protein EON64_07985 [archaeon]|nr:MAG: hypothetical protein EON64_07985 [archaeon]
MAEDLVHKLLGHLLDRIGASETAEEHCDGYLGCLAELLGYVGQVLQGGLMRAQGSGGGVGSSIKGSASSRDLQSSTSSGKLAASPVPLPPPSSSASAVLLDVSQDGPTTHLLLCLRLLQLLLLRWNDSPLLADRLSRLV